MLIFENITDVFHIEGDFVSAAPYGSGHIHDTYAGIYDQAGTNVRYIHQRINSNIFKNIPFLMQNISKTTDHQIHKLESAGTSNIHRKCLTVVPTVDGQSYHRDEDGDYWRTYLFIEKAQTYDNPENPDMVFHSAKAFGEFQQQLSDLSSDELEVTIPDFHNTPKRFEALEKAIEEDPVNRAADVKAEIDFAMQNRDICGVLIKKNQEGLIPERITHNDTKLNNVLIDDETGEGICVIDLDTVMPGLALYDFGDMVRTAAQPAAEDETDLSKVIVQMDLFEAITRGYLEAAGSMLTKTEAELLVFSASLITFEIGIRFLTDYLQGDTYFKIHRPSHNIDRVHVQFKFLKELQKNETVMQKLVTRALL